MALLRFDTKKEPYLLEAGWPRKGSAEKNGVSVRLVKRGPNQQMIIIRDVLHIPFDKAALKQGVHCNLPELGDLVIQYKKLLGLAPLISLSLNGQALKGNEVLESIFGEIG